MKRSTARWLAVGAGAAAALSFCAVIVRRQTEMAEAAHPPRGRFVVADGVRLHFTVRGRDDAEQTLVLLHGNGSMADEFEISGLVEQAAERYRVIVFDRPGYGWSERPAKRRWGPQEQGELIQAALARLGVVRPIVLGHSWGALVAMAMALDRPQAVSALVLVSGYYFPTLRLDVPLLSARAIPGLGALLRHTLSPLIGRALWPLAARRRFAPAPVPDEFKQRYPLGMALRPSQLHASAAESAWLIRSALALRGRYAELDVPTVVVTGAEDRQLSASWHSGRLAERIERGWLRVVENAGHMVHHVATGQVLAAVHQAGAMAHDPLLQLHPTGLKAGEPPAPLSAVVS
jgi:pimeloyl-ACP methyl ester carboxylesterase